MKRIVFLPDRPVDREGDLFFALVAQLGLTDWVIDEAPLPDDVVARDRLSTPFYRVDYDFRL